MSRRALVRAFVACAAAALLGVRQSGGVPQPDDVLLMFVSQVRHGACPQGEEASTTGLEPQPGSREDAQDVPMGDQRNVLSLSQVRFACGQHPATALGNILGLLARRFARWDLGVPNHPGRVMAVLPDLRCRTPFVTSVVPLQKVVTEDVGRQSGQASRLPGPLQRTASNVREGVPREVRCEGSGRSPAGIGERDVCSPCVLT